MSCTPPNILLQQVEKTNKTAENWFVQHGRETHNVTHPVACPFHVSHACIYVWRGELCVLACFAGKPRTRSFQVQERVSCQVQKGSTGETTCKKQSESSAVQKSLAFLQHKESYVTNHRPSSRISPTFSFPASDHQVPVYDGRSNWFAFEDGIDDWRDITEPDGKKQEPF